MYNAATVHGPLFLRFTPILLLATLAACAPGPTATPTQTSAAAPTQPPTSAPTETPAPTAFPLNEEGAFTGSPQDFLLPSDLLNGAYAAQEAGAESPNSRVLEGRADGEAYIEATGRIAGWLQQYDAIGEQDPPYIIQAVNTYASAEGASLVLSRVWHTQVWDRIDSGTLELLTGIPGLAVEHLVWRNAEGTVAVEMIYRNLYIFFTGPSNGADNYEFFAELTRSHLDWIRSREAE